MGFHAFYTIRNDEIPSAVAAMRDLAMTAPAQTGALRVSPALSAVAPEPYATKLRALPPKDDAKKHTKRDAVLVLSREISELKKREPSNRDVLGRTRRTARKRRLCSGCGSASCRISSRAPVRTRNAPNT